jgi:hypothetical protein
MMTFMLAMASSEDVVLALGTYDLSWAVDPVEEAAKPDGRALVVHVGGGKGQDLEALLRDTPVLPRNRCVFQDLPKTIKKHKQQNESDLAGVQTVGMDFHSEQLVKGM